jgi:hypothetical protein
METPDGLPVLIESNPAANRPGNDGEPKSVRDACDALADTTGKARR